jgi:hypothetical protein
MEKLQAFQAAAQEGGFVVVEESEEGSVLWLKKTTAEAEDRICIDSLTKSATVYWATIPWKIDPEDPDAWLARCVNTECDRLRNEAIRDEADGN